MSEQNENDILVNIPDEDLNELADMYRGHLEIKYASSTLTKGKRIREKQPSFIKFVSPGNCWREDGTFFVIIEIPFSYNLLVFTLDKSCKNVYEGLTKTNCLNWKKLEMINAVHSSIHPTLLKVISEKKLSVELDNPNYIYVVPKTVAINFDTICSDEVEVRKLESSHADLINSVWPHKYPHSEKYIRSIIELNGGYGVFLKTTGDLVAWALKSILGQLGMVQTLEDYRRNGYASLAVKHLSKEIAKDNEEPMGTVAHSNVVSQRTFEKMGFVNVGKCNYIHLDYLKNV